MESLKQVIINYINVGNGRQKFWWWRWWCQTKPQNLYDTQQRARCIRRSLDGFVLLVISLNLADGPTMLVQPNTTLMQWSLTQWCTDSMCTMHIVHSVHLYNALMHCCLIADPLCASPPLTSGGDEKLVLLPPQTLRPHLINPETRDDRICVEHFLVRFLRQTLSCNES